MKALRNRPKSSCATAPAQTDLQDDAGAPDRGRGEPPHLRAPHIKWGPASHGMCSQSSRQPTSTQLADAAEMNASRGPVTQVDSRAGFDKKFSTMNSSPASRVPHRTPLQHEHAVLGFLLSRVNRWAAFLVRVVSLLPGVVHLDISGPTWPANLA